MLNRLICGLLTGLFLICLVIPTFAQDRSLEIRQLLEQRDRDIKNLLGDKETFSDDQKGQLKGVINNGINFFEMGRYALGKYWDDLTEAQRTEFIDVFGEIVRTQSLSDVDVYRSRVSYGPISVEGNLARVITTTVYQDIETEVEYVMGYTGTDWRVNDIILDEVSTAEGYARSFQSVIRKRGFDRLMDRLRDKLTEVNT